MGSKKERHKAKLAARQAKIIQPKQTVFTSMIPVLKPAFTVRNEDPQEQHVKFWSALTSLRNSRGTAESFQFLYTRLFFGRIIATRHFTDEDAEHIHYTIGNLIISMDVQLEADENSTTMSLKEEIANDVHECLQKIEIMAGKITPDEYELCGVMLINKLQEDGSAEEYNLVEWEDFKKREGIFMAR